MVTRVHALDGYPMILPGGDVGRFLSRPEAVAAWVAVVGERVVGHVALHDVTSKPVMDLVDGRFPDPPAVYVSRLLVDPDARRRGIGRRLLAHATQVARTLGRRPFLDVVATSGSPAALALYADGGWEEIGLVRVELDGTSVDEHVYRAPLT